MNELPGQVSRYQELFKAERSGIDQDTAHPQVILRRLAKLICADYAENSLDINQVLHHYLRNNSGG